MSLIRSLGRVAVSRRWKTSSAPPAAAARETHHARVWPAAQTATAVPTPRRSPLRAGAFKNRRTMAAMSSSVVPASATILILIKRKPSLRATSSPASACGSTSRRQIAWTRAQSSESRLTLSRVTPARRRRAACFASCVPLVGRARDRRCPAMPQGVVPGPANSCAATTRRPCAGCGGGAGACAPGRLSGHAGKARGAEGTAGFMTR